LFCGARVVIQLTICFTLFSLDFLGSPIYVEVNDDHDYQGQIEGERRGKNLVLQIRADRAYVAAILQAGGRLAPAEQRRYRDQSAHDPHYEDHEEHELGVTALRVDQ